MIRLANSALRGSTLVSKFALLFMLAKFLSPAEVGMYGLLAGSIGYALYVVGFEYYNYSVRELIGRDAGQWLCLLRDVAVLYGVLYFLFLPLAFLIFYKGLLPWAYAVWFLALTVLEHAAQELNRILVAANEQLLASFILFLRSGFWCFFVIYAIWRIPELRNLEFVLCAWGLGVFLACMVGFFRVSSFDRTSLKNPIDWGWILQGIKIAIPLLLASLVVRGMFTFDRFWVESISGLGALGAYVFYMGMATAVLSFLDAGVIVFVFPGLVAAAKSGDDAKFSMDMKSLALSVILATSFLVLACWVSGYIILSWLDNPVYLDYFFILKWLLLAVFLYGLSMIPHLGLYAFGRDMPILYSQLAGFVGCMCVALVGGRLYGVVAIPLALCFGFAVILVWKLIAYSQMRNRQFSIA